MAFTCLEVHLPNNMSEFKLCPITAPCALSNARPWPMIHDIFKFLWGFGIQLILEIRKLSSSN
jgi:hypothetical protein